jgi:hypothetical protein
MIGFSRQECILMIKLRRMKWVGHVTQMGKEVIGRKARKKGTSRKAKMFVGG